MTIHDKLLRSYDKDEEDEFYFSTTVKKLYIKI